MHLIYCYTNLINNKKYIGQTNNLKRRIKQHKDDSFTNYSEARYNQLIHQAIRKYGLDNFEISILEDNIPTELIDEKEKYYINKYNTIAPNGYNLTEGGIANKTAPVSSKYEDVFMTIVEELKGMKSLKEIAEQFNMPYSYLSNINNGTRLFHENIVYPIRKSSNSPNKEDYQIIIDIIENTNLSCAKIAKQLNLSAATVRKVNNGQIKKMANLFPEKTFPLRKVNQ